MREIRWCLDVRKGLIVEVFTFIILNTPFFLSTFPFLCDDLVGLGLTLIPCAVR